MEISLCSCFPWTLEEVFLKQSSRGERGGCCLVAPRPRPPGRPPSPPATPLVPWPAVSVTRCAQGIPFSLVFSCVKSFPLKVDPTSSLKMCQNKSARQNAKSAFSSFRVPSWPRPGSRFSVFGRHCCRDTGWLLSLLCWVSLGHQLRTAAPSP